MINKPTLGFLTTLRSNNNREWFQENKQQYQASRDNFVHITDFLIQAISQFDKSIAGLKPSDCIFRINRDIRFSNDKSPYKTNFGAFICPGGRNSGFGGYYFHIEPGASMIAGGVYMPASTILKALRQEIFDNYEEFRDIITEAGLNRQFGNLWGEKLKTRPKGFAEDFDGIEYLKYKHYILSRGFSDNEILKPDYLNQVIADFKLVFPLNRFLNQAIREL